MFTLIYHPETREEIKSAVRYYEEECEGLGIRFWMTLTLLQKKLLNGLKPGPSYVVELSVGINSGTSLLG